jgi:hypothetical protein
MLSAKPSTRSFDELARSCLESAEWPEMARMAPRSLSAIFGKLDRDENIGWLAGRPEVQLALARVLGTSREVLRLALAPKKSAEPSRWVSFSDVPYARVLDLVEEPLFPGVPGEVLRPGAWQRLVWIAPSGGGRTLAGRWLEARGLAEVVSAPRIDEAALPVARPLFVELGSDVGLDVGALAPGVCIALPAPVRPAVLTAGAVVVRSPPVADLIEELVPWCRARLSAKTGLDAERLLRFLRSGPLESGAVESVGDVLGLCGLADAFGMEALEKQTLERAARDFFKRLSAERLDPDGPSTPWARRSGFDALVAVLRRFLVEGEPPFLERTTEEWSLALPAELKAGPDLDWLRTALPGADPGLMRSDVERAVTKLPPGAFRLLRTFETLGVLERSPAGLLALRPHWLARVAASEALREIVEGPPAGWGEALLSAKTATATATRLFERARLGNLPLDDFAEPDAGDSPVHAAAAEGAFRAVGLAALYGSPPPADFVEALWDEQLRLLFEQPGALPLPRIEHRTLEPAESGAFMLGRGAFVLAALAISEELEAGQGGKHELLRPWQATQAPPGFSTLLDAVASALELPGAPIELAGHVAALVGRLRSVIGPLGENGAPHVLERAAIIADETSLGVLGWPSIAALANDRSARAGTRFLVERRKLEGAFSEAVWQAFRDAGSPRDETDVLFSPELAPLVLDGAPDDVLADLVSVMFDHDGIFELFGARLPALVASAPNDAPLSLFRRVPETVLDAAVELAARARRTDAMSELWSRFPAALGRRAEALLARSDEVSRTKLAVLLASVPLDATESLVRALDVDSLMRAPGETLSLVRGLLHARLGARAPGWRDAYALFSELEDRCRALAKSSQAPRISKNPSEPPRR